MRKIGYGCTSWMDPRCSEEDAIKLVQTALENDCSVFDTSPMYDGGKNEATLAEGIGSNPKAFISTKIGVSVSFEEGMKFDGSPDFLHAEFEKSCKNLGRNPDLLILHRVSETTPVEESMSVFKLLKDSDQIKHVGICTRNCSNQPTNQSICSNNK